MSSSIAIPTALNPASGFTAEEPTKHAGSASSSSSYHGSPRPPHRTQDSPSPTQKKSSHERRPSLLSQAIARQECAIINIGDPEGPPRLISFLESSQGFVWNPEIFLPSYVECEYTPLENRRDPVHDIHVSDEEIRRMFPQ